MNEWVRLVICYVYWPTTSSIVWPHSPKAQCTNFWCCPLYARMGSLQWKSSASLRGEIAWSNQLAEPHWLLLVWLITAASTLLRVSFQFCCLPSRSQRLIIQPAPDVELWFDRKPGSIPWCSLSLSLMALTFCWDWPSAAECCSSCSVELIFPAAWSLCLLKRVTRCLWELLAGLASEDIAISPSVPPSGCQAKRLEQALPPALSMGKFLTPSEFSDVCLGLVNLYLLIYQWAFKINEHSLLRSPCHRVET